MIPSGFPGYYDTSIKCPNCKQDIGAKEKYIPVTIEENKRINEQIYEPINRDNYCRIFKDDEEIHNLENDGDKKAKLKQIKYMTKNQFKEKYIDPLYIKEKGLNKIDENNFKTVIRLLEI